MVLTALTIPISNDNYLRANSEKLKPLRPGEHHAVGEAGGWFVLWRLIRRPLLIQSGTSTVVTCG